MLAKSKADMTGCTYKKLPQKGLKGKKKTVIGFDRYIKYRKGKGVASCLRQLPAVQKKLIAS